MSICANLIFLSEFIDKSGMDVWPLSILTQCSIRCGHFLSRNCKKVPNVLSHCHTKRRTGAHGRVHLSFGMTQTFQKKKKKEEEEKKRQFQKKKVGVIPKEGGVHMAAPVLLLV